MRKKMGKCFQQAHDMILLMAKPKVSTKKRLEFIKQFRKFQGTRSTHENQLCFYNQQWPVKKGNSIQGISRNKFNQEVKDLYMNTTNSDERK